MAPPPSQAAARELLHVVLLVMRTVAADMRRAPRAPAPTQMGALMKIGAGPCTLSDLSRYQAVSLPTISKSVDILVRNGWVERWVDKQDRRQTFVRLTAKGRRVLADMKRRAEDHVAGRLAPLSPAERGDLVATLKTLTTTFSTPDAAACLAIKEQA